MTWEISETSKPQSLVSKGRGSIQPMVVSTLQVIDNKVLIDRYMPGFPNGYECDVMKIDPPITDNDAPVFLHICGVKNPTTKSRNVRYRIGASMGWTATFRIMWDKVIVSTDQMNAVVIDAGRLCGLGDGRNVGYGRFEVINFSTE